MKDKDFEEIGKRLYEHESDPPKDGWKKIGNALNTPAQPGRVVWLRKHWWKPLILLVPLAVYLVYHGSSGKFENTVTESGDTRASIENNQVITDSPSDAADDLQDINEGHSAESNTRGSQEGKQDDKEVISERSGNENSRGTESAVNDSTSSIVNKPNSIDNQNNKISPATKSQTPSNRDQQDLTTTNTTVRESNPILNQPVSNFSEESGSSHVTLSNAIKPENEDPLTVDPSNTSDQSNTIGHTTPVLPRDSSVTSFRTYQQVSISDDALLSQRQDSASLKQDSLQAPLRQDSTTESTGTVNDNSRSSSWRISILFAPQYLTRTAQPVANDEVLITDIRRSGYLESMGFNLGVGIGKQFGNLYLDGHLTYTGIKQQTQFASSTGAVDTLIAVRLPDQRVTVSPVYRITDRKISNRYSFGGVRVGATYYFWSGVRGRFNLTAAAGVHYLIQAEVKEKIDQRWAKLSSKDLSKVNYSFMLGAGYNIRLQKGWELMINPALTFYLKDLKSGDLPYHVREESFGVNFMLSKTLGLRK